MNVVLPQCLKAGLELIFPAAPPAPPTPHQGPAELGLWTAELFADRLQLEKLTCEKYMLGHLHSSLIVTLHLLNLIKSWTCILYFIFLAVDFLVHFIQVWVRVELERKPKKLISYHG